MSILIEIDNVRHKLIETDDVVYCNGACNTCGCSLVDECPGANSQSSIVGLLKFCSMFKISKPYAHFEIE